MRGDSATCTTTDHGADHFKSGLVFQHLRQVAFFEIDGKVHQRERAIAYDIARNALCDFYTEILRIRGHILVFRELDLAIVFRQVTCRYIRGARAPHCSSVHIRSMLNMGGLLRHQGT